MIFNPGSVSYVHSGLLRCGKSCRLRWINYLRPDIKRGNFSIEEDATIINLHQILGNRYVQFSLTSLFLFISLAQIISVLHSFSDPQMVCNRGEIAWTNRQRDKKLLAQPPEKEITSTKFG